MVKIQIDTKNKIVGEDTEQECLFIDGRKAKWHSHLGGQFAVFTKLNSFAI